MINDIPYNELKKNKRAYELMLLRDQNDKSFTDIAEEYKISTTRALEIYFRQKIKQILLYINHISVKLGCESTGQVRKDFFDAYECYEDLSYAGAYLEKKYDYILTVYRDGEPGMPLGFVKNMPPFKTRFNKKTIARVVEMHEKQKASFLTIAKKLKMTPAKAKKLYDLFYHEQVLELIKALQEKTDSEKEKSDIFNYYFNKYRSPKKCYDALTKK